MTDTEYNARVEFDTAFVKLAERQNEIINRIIALETKLKQHTAIGNNHEV